MTPSIADSRTKNNYIVFQIQKLLWRKLEPLLGRNKKLFSLKEVKEYAHASEGKSCRPDTKTKADRYVCHLLESAMTSQCETGGLTRTFQSIIYPAGGKKS